MKTSTCIIFFLSFFYSFQLYPQSSDLPQLKDFLSALQKEEVISRHGEKEILKKLNNDEVFIDQEWNRLYGQLMFVIGPAKNPALGTYARGFELEALMVILWLERKQSMLAKAYNKRINPEEYRKELENITAKAWQDHHLSFSPSKRPDIEQVVKILQWWQGKMEKHGVLKGTVAEDSKKWIKEHAGILTGIIDYDASLWPNELELWLKYVMDRMTFYQDLPLYQEEQERFMDQLERGGIIDESATVKLRTKIEEKGLLTPVDYFSAIPQAVVINYAEQVHLHENGKEQITYLLNTFQKLWPKELEIGEIKEIDLKDEEAGSAKTDPLPFVSLDGRLYKYGKPKFFLSAKELERYQKKFLKRPRPLPGIFNQFLTDEGSPYRLFQIMDVDPYSLERGNQQVLVLLDSSQMALLKDEESISFYLSEKGLRDEFRWNSYKEMEQVLSDFDSVGLVGEMLPSAKDIILAKSRTNWLRGEAQLLRMIPSRVLSLDKVSREAGENSFDSFYLFEEIRGITDGYFDPRSRGSSFDAISGNKGLNIFLEFKGDTFALEKKLPFRYTTLDFHVDWMNLILEAYEKAGEVENEFYCLSRSGYPRRCTSYIYLNNEQHTWLRKNYPKAFKLD